MYKFTVRTEEMNDCECRNRCPRNPAGLYAGIYDSDGYGVANIDRLGRRDGGGKVDFLHDQIEGNDEPDLHATTDEQWQSIIDCLTAAPKMLAACKAALAAINSGKAADAAHARKLLREAVSAADPAADPPSLVRSRVSVTVEVEIETTPGDASLPGNVKASAVEAVRDGEGEVVSRRIVPA